MTITEFVMKLEETYGSYKSGMRNIILDRLKYADGEGLRNLYSVIVENYDGIRPPSFAKIMDMITGYGLHVQTDQYSYFVSVCEFCGQEFPLDYLVCPSCKKPRKFGLVTKRFAKKNQAKSKELSR